MTVNREVPNPTKFNAKLKLPFALRLKDFEMAMQDVYDFFYDVNSLLLKKHLGRFDDILRPAAMSGMISDMLTASLSNHSRNLAENKYHNGHPDLIVHGVYPNNAIKAGIEGVEIKSTRKKGGRRRHAWRPRSVDVCFRLSSGFSNGARDKKKSDEIYRSISWPSDGCRFPQELARRTWHANGHS